jgi:hypothetical protein
MLLGKGIIDFSYCNPLNVSDLLMGGYQRRRENDVQTKWFGQEKPANPIRKL